MPTDNGPIQPRHRSRRTTHDPIFHTRWDRGWDGKEQDPSVGGGGVEVPDLGSDLFVFVWWEDESCGRGWWEG